MLAKATHVQQWLRTGNSTKTRMQPKPLSYIGNLSEHSSKFLSENTLDKLTQSFTPLEHSRSTRVGQASASAGKWEIARGCLREREVEGRGWRKALDDSLCNIPIQSNCEIYFNLLSPQHSYEHYINYYQTNMLMLQTYNRI